MLVAGGLVWNEQGMSHRRHGAYGVHSLVVSSSDISLEGLGHRVLGLLLLEQVSVDRLGCPSLYLENYLPAKQK